MPAILQLKEIRKSFGPQVIFDRANMTLNSEQKAGFIGRNGAGKSTLCKIIIGQEAADHGEVIKSSDLRLSYLEQQTPFVPSETVLEFLMRYTGQEAWRCGKVAARFQLKHQWLEAEVASLSGGYQTRVKLTAMLLNEPNFLILDEPSNYLDLKTLILLEEFLEDFDGGFVIVSHDREFLKKTCDHTLEAEQGQLTLYPGTVEEYLTFKREQEEQAMKYNKTVEGKRKQLQAFVDRFRAKASKASQARAKMKQIEKLKPIDIAQTQRTVHFNIPAPARRKGTAFRCENLQIGYPENLVAQSIQMDVDHGAHVAILGDNGQGKTTFMRTIAGQLPAKGGSFRWGYACEIAYYAQHVVASMNPKDTVLAHLTKQSADEVTHQEILAMAGSFLFKGPDLKKTISVLSGGECSRVCLAGLLLSKRTVLLLDEPTNHLDFETVEALAAALHQHSGIVFFISHDRTFVNLIATEIVEVREGTIRRYPGTYADFVYRMESDVRRELTAEPSNRSEVPRIPRKETDPRLLKQRETEKRRLTNQIKQCEKQQSRYGEEKASLEALMRVDPQACTHERARRYEQLTRLSQEEEQRWVRLNEQFEAL
jgi:ATP-binding cassette, subfamily F, member 3